MTTPLVLGLLAVVLTGPVPVLLARVPALRRTPAATLVLWQALALAAVLSALGAGLSLVTVAVWGQERSPLDWVVAVLALLLTALVTVRLLLTGHRVGTGMRASRQAHAAQVDLLARRDRSGVHVLDHPVPVAYCLPAMRRSKVVLSAGAIAGLTPGQLDAVVAHERAHVRARHDLVLEAFTVLHEAFPSWVASGTARREVTLLVEVLADRSAIRVAGPRALGEALLAVAGGRAPAGSVGLGGAERADPASGHLAARAALLGDTGPRRGQAAALLASSAALLALPTVLVVLPWLLSLPA